MSYTDVKLCVIAKKEKHSYNLNVPKYTGLCEWMQIKQPPLLLQ